MYLEKLAEADTEIGDSGAPHIPPKDFEMDKFNRGKKFLQDHLLSNTLSMLISLTCGLSVTNLLDPLTFTEQSDTPKKALKRYGATFVHVSRWYYGNIWDKNNFAYKSIMAVRKMHNKVRKNMMEHKSMSCPMITSQKMRLSQYDMSLVQCGFFGPVVMYPELCGIRCTEEDLEDLVYFWYGVGYALGITDKNNICYHGYHVCSNICREIEQNILLPAMRHPPKDFQKMASAFIDGINNALRVPLLSVESIIAIAYKSMGENVPKMSFINNCRYLYLIIWIDLLYYLPFFEKCFCVLHRFIS